MRNIPEEQRFIYTTAEASNHAKQRKRKVYFILEEKNQQYALIVPSFIYFYVLAPDTEPRQSGTQAT
jgi:hypothetical protein